MGNHLKKMKITSAFALILMGKKTFCDAKPLIHPDTGLAITTTGYHWYEQEPLALAQKPLIHPDTGLAITTTGYHWYGQEPLALSQKARHQEGVRFIGDRV